MPSLTEIQEGVVRTLDTLVGINADPTRQLVTSKVIKSNVGGIRPDFPLIVVGKVRMPNYGISGASATYFNDDLELTHETRYKASLYIQIHGGKDHDVDSIAQQVRDHLFRQYGIDLLQEETGAGLLNISGVDFSYNFMNTDYEEVARLGIDFSVTQVFVENGASPSSGEITTITQTGELDRIPDDDSPININTTVP